ncbi:MAG: hypothetical protein HAW67_04060 [Endozoicomonadaceae bacterium]|nr:hypothetical protein [Endozoicomonadaceae bacterium]
MYEYATKDAAISALKNLIKANLKGPKTYVGITNDPERRKREHEADYGITITDFPVIKCKTNKLAQEVEDNWAGGGGGNGNESSVYVYAFSYK